MKKIWITLLMLCMPALAIAADSSLSFTPPPTDYSVIFLGNIFGIVDGVLHGTGSQVMGNLFGVFNAAVLALGGIVVMYTLVVGTMNTAQEGQMLGQKWSSIWIPVRATIGLAFLIPKASGYCLMQIFVMWVVVQGAGAADKVWNSVLDYLNRGGAIVKAQQSMNSTTSSDNDAIITIATGAQQILSGQVCMQGLQKLLETQHDNLLKAAEHGSGSGKCSKQSLASGGKSSPFVYFCNNPVPDFIGSVNVITAANKGFVSACSKDYKQGSTGTKEVPMPNFKGTIYADLNGYCGTIKWNEFDPDLSSSSTLSCQDIDTTRQSRAVAIQQMYSDLTSTAVEMIDNDPQLTPRSSDTDANNYSDVARNQFGIPLMDNGEPCDTPSSKCVSWGPQTGENINQTLAFTGFEFQNAMLDYNGIMLPALTLQKQQNDSDAANKLKSFIQGSEEQGWIMAGGYFFNLVYLNGLVTSSSDQVDDTSGLDGSSFNVDDFASTPFDGSCTTTLCKLFDGDQSGVNKLAGLMNGSTIGSETITPVVNTQATSKTDIYSATTFGFITNGSMVHLPGQPGLNTPNFKMNFNIQPGQTLLSFPKKSFSCGGRIFGTCIARPIADAFYNKIFRGIVNIVIAWVVSVFNLMLQTFLYVPLDLLMVTFNNGVQLLETTMIHPIIALAYMGSSFINAGVDIWLNLITFSLIFGSVPVAGIIFLVAIFLVLPFLASWLGVMVAVGWIDAYYAPFIPYMIFTFGSLAWFMAVIESMVAGPIIALGISHPEGHDALGKAEQAIMILINVFLRPSMMIIGYIGSISLSYVAVFVLNSGFVQIMKFFIPSDGVGDFWTAGVEDAGVGNAWGGTYEDSGWSNAGSMDASNHAGANLSSPYYNWSAIYASFFCLVTYTSLYLTVVQKSFTLIHTLPDKILRWIGSQGESISQETAQWSEDAKGQVKETGQETGKSSMKTGGMPMGIIESVTGMANKGGSGGSTSAQ